MIDVPYGGLYREDSRISDGDSKKLLRYNNL